MRSASLAEAAALDLPGKRSLVRIAHRLIDDRTFIVTMAAALIAVRVAASAIGGLVSPLASIPSSAHALGPVAAWLQESVPYAIGVPALGAAYVPALIFLLVLVPLALIAADRCLFHRYAKALILAYAVSLSIHIVIGSVRPGMDPATGIAPLLYGDGSWGPLSEGLMGRGSSFPSTHVTVVTVMYLATRGLGKLNASLLMMLVIMSAAVLYLGVHWPVDVAAGAVTGAGSYLAVMRMEKKAGEGVFIRWRPG